MLAVTVIGLLLLTELSVVPDDDPFISLSFFPGFLRPCSRSWDLRFPSSLEALYRRRDRCVGVWLNSQRAS
ncbi:MAG TPA: hypothetical protein VK878_00335 [Candidatus Deferrimicrobiaceae bacterium]|nr:hypothetical protein [Candidatus Deferrimicrobiaceae bacterium]